MAERTKKQHVRIKDVAELADVSAQTVSNVLNGRIGFTPETRDRVMQAVEATGYRPDPAARNLRTRRSRRIGFSMSEENLDPRNPFALAFLQEILSAAHELDRRVIMLLHDTEADGTFRADVDAREVDGFILANSAPGDYRVSMLTEHHVPFALMGRTEPGQPQPWMDIDNFAAIAPAVDHLVERGHREFAFVGYAGEQHWNRDRLNGVRHRLASHGLTLPDDRVVESTLDAAEGGLVRLLRQTDRPTAVITSSDSLGVLAVGTARAVGLRVPEDIAVTGFDGGVLANSTMPPLTTVRIPVARIARELMARLESDIELGASTAGGEIVETELVIGGTT